jgi:hypothetical protein
MKVAKHSSLLYSYNYCYKKFYSSGPRDEEKWALKLTLGAYAKIIALVNGVAK